MNLAAQKVNIRPVHPFPARMAPTIVWDVLPQEGNSLNILDPMSGSGTTLVHARMRGHNAYGCDTDPLSLLISRTWCADVDPKEIMNIAEIVFEQAKKLSVNFTIEESYPSYVDAETRQFIDFWFDSENRRDLTALAICISRIQSESIRIFLWTGFSRMIITKTSGVSLAMDVSHSRPHKVYEVAPLKPFDIFLKAVTNVVNNCPFSKNSSIASSAIIQYGDARSLPIENESIDLIITSPPYLNAIDYLRGHKLSLVWMGYKISEIRAIRSSNIGSEVSMKSMLDNTIQDVIEVMIDIDSLDNRRLEMIRRYVWDMNEVIKECARVLKKNGRAIFVVGDSSIKGVFVKNSDGLVHLASNYGLTLTSRNTRSIEPSRRYMPPPELNKSGVKMNSRMKEEVILEFHH